MSIFAPTGFCAACRRPISPMNDFKFAANGDLLHRACEVSR